MNHIFISNVEQPLDRWLAAFPTLMLTTDIDVVENDDIAWLDVTGMAGTLEAVMQALQLRRVKFVVLEPSPTDQGGLRCMTAGAVGYGHRFASAEQLQGIAVVIDNGGVWLGQSLLQKVISSSLTIGNELNRVAAPPTPSVDLSALTERELAVAKELGTGASNREIAESLSISERTVKAHLSVVFEKLTVRDRVQLALLMNNVQR